MAANAYIYIYIYMYCAVGYADDTYSALLFRVLPHRAVGSAACAPVPRPVQRQEVIQNHPAHVTQYKSVFVHRGIWRSRKQQFEVIAKSVLLPKRIL